VYWQREQETEMLMRRWQTVARTSLAFVIGGVLSFGAIGHASDKDGDDSGPGALRPGETMTGIYAMGAPVGATMRTVGAIDAQINFPRPVNDNAAYKVELIAQGAPPTANCPGVRRAAPGFLCVYEVFKDSRERLGGVYNPIDTTFRSVIDRDGAVLFGFVESADSDDGDAPFSTGGWAITGRERRTR
jgi:hypothetical protein